MINKTLPLLALVVGANIQAAGIKGTRSIEVPEHGFSMISEDYVKDLANSIAQPPQMPEEEKTNLQIAKEIVWDATCLTLSVASVTGKTAWSYGWPAAKCAAKVAWYGLSYFGTTLDNRYVSAPYALACVALGCYYPVIACSTATSVFLATIFPTYSAS